MQATNSGRCPRAKWLALPQACSNCARITRETFVGWMVNNLPSAKDDQVSEDKTGEAIAVGRSVNFSAAIVAIAFLGSVAGIRFVTLDDRWYAAWAWHNTWIPTALQIAAEQGRFPKLTSFLQFLPYLTDSAVLQGALRLLTILGGAWIAGRLLEKVTDRPGLAASFVILFFAFAQNSNEHNLFVAYPFAWEFSWLCWMIGVFGLIAAIERGSIALACWGAIIWLTGLQEGFLPQTAVHLVVAYTYWRLGRKSWSFLVPYFLGLAIWLATWLLWRASHTSLYEGSQLALDEPFSVILRTTANYTFGGVPFATFLYGGASLSIEVIRQSLGTLSVIKAAAVFFGAIGVANYVKLRSRPIPWRNYLGLSLVLTFLAFAPNMVIGLTPKYQEWMRLGSHAYLYSHFSYYAWIALLCLWLSALFLRFKSRYFAIMTASILSLGSILTDALNFNVNSEQRQMGRRWDSMLGFFESDLFESLPRDSSFWFRDASVSGSEKDDAVYWQYVAKARTGKDVHVTSDLRLAQSSSGGGSYLYLYDEPRSENQYVLVAPFLTNTMLAPSSSTRVFGSGFEPMSNPWIVSSRRVWVFPNSLNQKVHISGTFVCEGSDCSSSISVDGKALPTIFNKTFSVSATSVVDENGVKVLEVATSRPFDVTSVSVDFPRTLPPAEAPVEISMDEHIGDQRGAQSYDWTRAECDSTLWLKNLDRDQQRFDIVGKMISSYPQNVEIASDDGNQKMRVGLPANSPQEFVFPFVAHSGLSALHLRCEPIVSTEGAADSRGSLRLMSVGLRMRDGGIGN